MPVISSYAAASAVTDDDVFIGNDGTVTKKFPATVIRTYAKSGATAMTLNTRTADYTAVLADANDDTIVVMNVASANQFIIPPNATVAYPIGIQIEVLQLGAGQTTIVQGAGVTIGTTSTLKLLQQYARAVLLKTGTNTWAVSGEMALT